MVVVVAEKQEEKCKVSGCTEASYLYGYCEYHYVNYQD